MFAPSIVRVSLDGRSLGEGSASDSHEIEDVARRIMDARGASRCDYVAIFEDGQRYAGEIKQILIPGLGGGISAKLVHRQLEFLRGAPERTDEITLGIAALAMKALIDRNDVERLIAQWEAE
jgi:hypothetical protein